MQRIDDDRADAWFHALSDRTRRDILRRVLRREESVSSLARNYPMSLTAVQKHVVVLERAGLLTRRRHGRESRARGAAGTLRTASAMLTELEQSRREHIARIDELLTAEKDPHREDDGDVDPAVRDRPSRRPAPPPRQRGARPAPPPQE